MRRSTTLYPLAVLVLALAPACSGAVAYNLGGTGGSRPDSGSGSGSGSGGTTEDSGPGETDAGPAPVDAVAVIDVNEPVEATPIEEPPPAGPAVACPMNGSPATCQQGQYCCVAGDATQGTQTDTCTASGATCVGTPVRCAVTADCPGGQVCCGTQQTVGATTTYTEVACAASCTGTNKRTFCDPRLSDCPAATPTCGQSQLLPGYNVCQ